MKRPSPAVVGAAGGRLNALQFPKMIKPCVKSCSRRLHDYPTRDPSNRGGALDGFSGRRGAERVRGGRPRTTILSAVEAIGRLPHFYLQHRQRAGARRYEWPAARGRRAIRERLPRLLLSQNCLRADSTCRGVRPPGPARHRRGDGKKQISRSPRTLLSKPQAPYGPGGVFDILTEPAGTCWPPTTSSPAREPPLRGRREGIDIDPRAGCVRPTAQGPRATGDHPRGDRAADINGRAVTRQRLDRALVPARPAAGAGRSAMILLDGTLDRVVSLFS